MSQHKAELAAFLVKNKVDILLISETHFTSKSFFKIQNYNLYHTAHPDDKAHGGSAILVKGSIRHHQEIPFRSNEIQATNIIVEDSSGQLLISAVYSPPKHNIKQEYYEKFFKSLGNRFIAGGDYNAKHTQWGSRLTTSKGRQLLSAAQKLNLKHVSSGEPTYWPTDMKKVPDLIDFFITKGINSINISCNSSYGLSSDHSPVVLNLSEEFLQTKMRTYLSSHYTDWQKFKRCVIENINLKIPLKSEADINEAVEHFNDCIQQAAWSSTPVPVPKQINSKLSLHVREKIAEKRQARKTWQQSRHPKDKSTLNKLSTELKKLIEHETNQKFEKYLSTLDTSAKSDYSLWKAAKQINASTTAQPPILRSDKTWAKSNQEKATEFGNYLVNVFKPNSVDATMDTMVLQRLDEAHQLDLPIRKFKCCEVKTAIGNLIGKKSAGYDLITPKLLKEMPENGVKFLTQLFNAIISTGNMPCQWKVAKIIMILKPGKTPTEPTSYRPISLLPITSKLLESLFLKRFMPIIDSKKIIPQHQFGFRKNHGTIEQIHRLVEQIFTSFEEKKYCTAAFLDVSQAFDKVWHDGLLFKLKNVIPINYYLFIRSYLQNRYFFVENGEEMSELYPVSSGVPQGSVMGPILYLIFTADLPLSENVVIGTFADDTAVLSVDSDPIKASQKLQASLDKICRWTKCWGIKTNETKSVNVTFTTRKGTCPPVMINDTPIPTSSSAKYLGMHLDHKLNWKNHIFVKRKALGLQLRKMFCLLNKKSKLSTNNKVNLYKVILKPIWTYGIQLWGTAAQSNIDILQRFQSKVLRSIVNAPWYITNAQLHRELNIKTVKEEISIKAAQYKIRISLHPNELASQLMARPTIFQRLKRIAPQNL